MNDNGPNGREQDLPRAEQEGYKSSNPRTAVQPRILPSRVRYLVYYRDERRDEYNDDVHPVCLCATKEIAMRERRVIVDQHMNAIFSPPSATWNPWMAPTDWEEDASEDGRILTCWRRPIRYELAVVVRFVISDPVKIVDD